MNENESPAGLQLACCRVCGGFSYPAGVPGCRVCGAGRESLDTVLAATPLRLRNFATVFAPLAPGLEVPCVIGEIELAPGLVEEARIAAADESGLAVGDWLVPERDASGHWLFRPGSLS